MISFGSWPPLDGAGGLLSLLNPWFLIRETFCHARTLRFTASMQKRFCFSIQGRAYGPVPAGELKRLASAGKISPADLVWIEGTEKKVPGANVKGLFPEPSAATTATAPTKHPQRKSATPPAGPLVRIHYSADIFKRGLLRLFHGYQIVGVFDDKLAYANSAVYPRLEEQDCTDTGLAAYLARCAFFKSVSIDSVTAASFHGTARRSLSGKLRPFPEIELRIRAKGGEDCACDFIAAMSRTFTAGCVESSRNAAIRESTGAQTDSARSCASSYGYS